MEPILHKPKIGEKCNGCGLCCMIQVCRNGAYVQGLVKQLGETIAGPCPALIDERDGTFSCEIVLNPKKYFKRSKYREDVLCREFALLIGAGTGCDEIGYDEDPEEERKLELEYQNTLNDVEKMNRYREAVRIIHNIS